MPSPPKKEVVNGPSKTMGVEKIFVAISRVSQSHFLKNTLKSQSRNVKSHKCLRLAKKHASLAFSHSPLLHVQQRYRWQTLLLLNTEYMEYL